MPTVNGFNTSQGVLKYNWESLENYNTPDFDSSKTYTLNDYSMYNGKLYKYISAVSSSGGWDSSKWQAVALSDEVKQLFQNDNNLSEDINDINDNIEIIESEMVSNGIIANEFNINSNYSIGDYVFYNNQLYKFTSDHSAGVWDDTDVVVVTLSGELKNVTNNINNLSSDLDETNSNLSDLNTEVIDVKSALNTKAGILRDTVSGSVASFIPDATIPDLLGLDVHLEPIQDLHGYDSPWPAGGGKNKINAPDITLTSGGYIYNGALILPAGTYTMSLTWSGSGTPSTSFGIFDADGNALVSGSHNFPYTFTISAESATARFYASAVGTYSKIQIESGSTATAWTPYSNICPISGRESVEVEATGINIWDEEWELGAYNHNTGAKIPSSNTIRSKNYIPIVGGNSYAFRAVSLGYAYLFYYDANNAYISRETPNISSGFAVFTPPSDVKYLGFYAYGTQNTFSISINYPSADHDYHPYSGNRYTIQLGQTIYGGTLDVTGGKMYARPYFLSYNGQALVGPWVSSMDAYTPGASPTVGAQVVDMGGAVNEITLDPVTIATIANQINNVFSPDGDVTVEYAADLKTYIDNKIAAAVVAMS